MPELILSLKGRTLRNIRIHKAVTIIGRDPTCEVFIDNPSVSRAHARIEMQGEQFVLFDQGSANGSFVNGTKVRRHTLADGDDIHVGKFSLTFSEHTGSSFVLTPESKNAPPVAPLHNPETTMHLGEEQLAQYLKNAASGGPGTLPASRPAPSGPASGAPRRRPGAEVRGAPRGRTPYGRPMVPSSASPGGADALHKKVRLLSMLVIVILGALVAAVLMLVMR